MVFDQRQIQINAIVMHFEHDERVQWRMEFNHTYSLVINVAHKKRCAIG